MKFNRTLLILTLIGLFSSGFAQTQTACPDGSEYFTGGKAYEYADGFLRWNLPTNWGLESQYVESKSYVDMNNDWQFEPSHTDWVLNASGKRWIVRSIGGDLIRNTGDFSQAVETLMKAFLAECIYELQDGRPVFKNEEPPVQSISEWSSTIYLKLVGNYGIGKTAQVSSEAFTVGGKLYIGITAIQRTFYNDETYDMFQRWTVLYSKEMLIVSQVGIFNDEKETGFGDAYDAIAPALAGVEPKIPERNPAMEREIAGKWKSAVYTQSGTQSASISVGSVGGYTFATNGKYTYSGSATIMSRNIIGTSDFDGKQGEYFVLGKRLVMTDAKGQIRTYFIDKPEKDFMTLSGRSYTREK